MVRICSLGYFVRDMIVLLLSLGIVFLLLSIGKNTKRNLGSRYFVRSFNVLVASFILVALAELMGVLMRTDVFWENEVVADVRSVILTLGALLLFVSSIMVYLPFSRNEYTIVPIVTEPLNPSIYGAYWGSGGEASKAFVKLVKSLHLPAIVLSRDPPEVFRSKLGLKLVPVVWISKVSHDDAVDPRRLPYLLDRILNFLKSTETDKVVYIDCLEYLMLENGDEAILKFVTKLKDLASLHRGIVIINLEKSAINEKTFHVLVSELRPVKELEKMLGGS
ncbi:DUF835 domain-containing protein [Thermococcus sp. AM4]|uniref:DUF835 domain-containing protein n=1 Tax=Thermococcus sp. (strain AM4) TaxID=246969 RepID=UPI000187135B|nr:DUF835 domain-containing protein [Thermococcus sp. AM4]EEB73529.1 conserved hypothetical protein [Thermococcus sp. AM4]